MRKLKVILIAFLAAAMISAVGCAGDTDTKTSTAKSNTTTEQSKATSSDTKKSETVKTIIYLPTDDASGVKAKTIELKNSTPQQKIEALLKADGETKYPIFPKGVTVNSVVVKDGVALIDLSEEFSGALNAGTLSNQLQLAALVNTLTEDNTIKKVKLSLAGKKLGTLGQVDLTEGVQRMDKFIKK